MTNGTACCDELARTKPLLGVAPCVGAIRQNCQHGTDSEQLDVVVTGPQGEFLVLLRPHCESTVHVYRGVDVARFSDLGQLFAARSSGGL
jgi:ABC-type arginine transport system ATPase subunit